MKLFCEDCGELFNVGDMEGDYCYSCSDSDSGDCTGVIHRYGYKPNLTFHITKNDTKKPLFLGIELEMESRNGHRSEQANTLHLLNEDEDLFFMGEDCSINNGFEIITHPATLQFHLREFPWKDICQKMISMGARSHDVNSCGLHIHVNKEYFSTSELVKLGLFVHTLTKPLSFLGRRERVNWAKFKAIGKKGKKNIHQNHDRYEAINFIPEDTVEFRLYKGTLNFRTVLATIDMTSAICHFVKNFGSSKIINKKVETWQNFLVFAKSNHHKHFIKYMTDRQERYGNNLDKKYHL